MVCEFSPSTVTVKSWGCFLEFLIVTVSRSSMSTVRR